MSSHVARRTFVTYALRSGWQPEVIRAITGHTTSKMMMNYVKMDMDAKQEFMNLLDHDEIEETVFDYDITDEERKTLDIPVKDEYLENISHNRELAISHLGMLFQRRGDIEKSVDCMNQLPKSEQVKFMQALISMKFQGLKDGKSK